MVSRKWHARDTSGTGPTVTQTMSQALVVQTYCLSVAQQPIFDFSQDPDLRQFQDGLNNTVKQAQSAANGYLNDTQPGCLDTLNNLIRFINLQNTRINNYKNGTLSAADLVAALQKVHDIEVKRFQDQCTGLQEQVDAFRQSVSTISGDYVSWVNQLNNAVSGDGGVLQSLKNQLDGVEKAISTASEGSVLGVLGMIGGAVIAAIGGAGEVVTGGASTVLVAGGVAIFGASSTGEGFATKSLVSLLNQKAQILQQIATIKLEVTQAHSSSASVTTLHDQAVAAASALIQMANAWTIVGKSLQNIIDDIEIDTGDFTDELTDYQKAITTLFNSCNTIQTQFTGVKQVQDNSRTVAALVTQQLARLAA